MSKLRDLMTKMTGKTVAKTQASVGAMGGNSTVIAKCIKYDNHRKLCTIYDPLGKEPQQRFRGDDGDMSKYETLQGGRTIKVPWQPIDSGEDREDPGAALEEFHMLGVRDLDDVEPEQLYDYIEMLTAFQKINKGTSRFLRMIVDQRKFTNGSGGGINRHWVQQIMVEVQYDIEGWPDSARATRIIESCPIPTQKPTANSVPPGDPMPCTMTPDGQMFFDRSRFDSECDWLLDALGSFQRPSQASDDPNSTGVGGDTSVAGAPSGAPSGGQGGGFNNNMPFELAASPNKPLITTIGPISISQPDSGPPSAAPPGISGVGDGISGSPPETSAGTSPATSPATSPETSGVTSGVTSGATSGVGVTQTSGDSAGSAITGASGGGVSDTEVNIADGVVLPVISANTITDPTSTDTWEVSRDPINGSPRANRYRMFGFNSVGSSRVISKGAGRTMPQLSNPIAQRHLLGVSHLYEDEGPWITIHTLHKGAPVHACGDGVVRFAGFSSLFGCNTIVIEHAHNLVTVYTYCYGPSITVRKGQFVNEKQIIALLEKTGDTALMRFGMFDAFNPVDPLNYIKGWKRMRRI
jgi:hypothetical protein